MCLFCLIMVEGVQHDSQPWVIQKHWATPSSFCMPIPHMPPVKGFGSLNSSCRNLYALCRSTRLDLSRYTVHQSGFQSIARCQSAKWPSSRELHTSQIMAPQLDSYFKQVDTLSESFIDRLRDAVAIPSISSDEARRADVVKVR